MHFKKISYLIILIFSLNTLAAEENVTKECLQLIDYLTAGNNETGIKNNPLGPKEHLDSYFDAAWTMDPLDKICKKNFNREEEYDLYLFCKKRRPISNSSGTILTPSNPFHTRNPVLSNDLIIKLAVAEIQSNMAKIVALRLKIGEFYQNNHEIYSEYLIQKKENNELKNQLEINIALRVSSIDKYNKLISDINPNYGTDYVNKAKKQFEKEKKNELKKIDDVIKKLEKRKEKTNKEFEKAFAKWSPYQAQIDNINQLEAQLLNALDRLNRLVKDSGNDISLSLGQLRDSSPPLLDRSKCYEIHKNIIDFKRDLELSNINFFENTSIP